MNVQSGDKAQNTTITDNSSAAEGGQSKPKSAKDELTDQQLDKASGGLSDIVVTKPTDSTSPKLFRP